VIRTKINLSKQEKHNSYPGLSWVDFENISNFARIAVIATEDQNFFEHNGFDFDSIKKARDDHADGKHLRGASTITQQVAKNLFLWKGKSWIRKGIEAYYTLLLELFLPKKRILELYLNIAEFGDNVYGIDQASKILFNKTPKKLTASDCALLAAVLPNPKRSKANRPSDYILNRRDWILDQVEQLDGLTIINKL